MRGVLVDTGPLVATIDADDDFHGPCVAAWRHLREPLLTVWPVVTEAMHLVGGPLAQDRLWQVLDARHLQIIPLDVLDIPRMRALMSKYADRPMDLADAALVRVAEREHLTSVFTTDQDDFATYRLHGTRRFRIFPRLKRHP